MPYTEPPERSEWIVVMRERARDLEFVIKVNLGARHVPLLVCLSFAHLFFCGQRYPREAVDAGWVLWTNLRGVM